MVREEGHIHVDLTIKSYLNSLRPAERRVADYILAHARDTMHLSISKLAQKAQVSEGTIVKFCQKIGFSGYQDLKISLAKDSDSREEEHIYGEIQMEDDLPLITKKLFQIYHHSLKSTSQLLLEAPLEKAVDFIQKSRCIYLFGFGASSIVAIDGEMKFQRINIWAKALTDNHSQKTVAALLTPEDLVIAISDSGKTKELYRSLEVAKDVGAPIIAITSNQGSPVTTLAQITLLVSSQETSFRGSAIASRIAQMTVMDLLFLGTATGSTTKTLEALKKTRLVMQENKM